MLRWTLIDRGAIPGGGEMRLMQRGDEFSIRLGSTPLMNSRGTGSEEALATLACHRLKGRRRPHLLIGGLGMGFTLRAALAVLGPDARVTVAELVPAVVAWARGPLAGLYGSALEDPRVRVRTEDVGRLIAAARGTYDAILLDVDNGPEGLTREANDALYDDAGLGAARQALKKDGILAVWSSTPNKRFAERLRRSGFRADEVRVGASEGGGARSIIWFASPADAEPPRPAARRRRARVSSG